MTSLVCFLCADFQEPYAVVVLLEKDLVVIDLAQNGWVGIFKYPSWPTVLVLVFFIIYHHLFVSWYNLLSEIIFFSSCLILNETNAGQTD